MAERGDQNLANLASAVVAGDPELQDQLRRLAKQTVRHAQWIMREGTTAERTRLMNSMVPYMLKSMGSLEDDAAAEEEKGAVERVMAALRGEDDAVAAVAATVEPVKPKPRVRKKA
jgi:hypothetical protein